RLRIRPVEGNVSGGRWCRLLAELHEPSCQPARKIEEVQLLNMAGQAPQLCHERRQQGIAELRVSVQLLHEDGSRKRERLGWLDRGGRRGAWLTVEQRELPKEVRRVQRGDDRLVPLSRGEHDLHRA